MYNAMKNGIFYQMDRAPETAARNVAGGGCDWVVGRKLPKGVVIGRNGGCKNSFGGHVS